MNVQGVANAHLDASEHHDGIVFLHKVQRGAASKSYGLQVAKLAGIPREVLAAAKDKLQELESGAAGLVHPLSHLQSTPPPFSSAPTSPRQPDLFADSRCHAVLRR
jgi:DNA mismatch repair protein MutS